MICQLVKTREKEKIEKAKSSHQKSRDRVQLEGIYTKAKFINRRCTAGEPRSNVLGLGGESSNANITNSRTRPRVQSGFSPLGRARARGEATPPHRNLIQNLSDPLRPEVF